MLYVRIELAPLPMRLLSLRSYLNVCSTLVNKYAPYTNKALVDIYNRTSSTNKERFMVPPVGIEPTTNENTLTLLYF